MCNNTCYAGNKQLLNTRYLIKLLSWTRYDQVVIQPVWCLGMKVNRLINDLIELQVHHETTRSLGRPWPVRRELVLSGAYSLTWFIFFFSWSVPPEWNGCHPPWIFLQMAKATEIQNKIKLPLNANNNRWEWNLGATYHKSNLTYWQRSTEGCGPQFWPGSRLKSQLNRRSPASFWFRLNPAPPSGKDVVT